MKFFCLFLSLIFLSSPPQRLSSLSFFSAILPFFRLLSEKKLQKKPGKLKKVKYPILLLGFTYLNLYLSTVRCVRLVWLNSRLAAAFASFLVIASLRILKSLQFDSSCPSPTVSPVSTEPVRPPLCCSCVAAFLGCLFCRDRL